MALSTVVFVGSSKEWIPELVSRASKLKVSEGFVPDADLGPMITPEAKSRCESLIQSGIDEGAECVLDGRGLVVEGPVKILISRLRKRKFCWTYNSKQR